MENTRFEQQVRFILEIDKMTRIVRHTLLVDGSRLENDAEHSWQVAVMAMLLREYAEPDVDTARAVQMCLVHDLIEIYAGDTFAFDPSANLDKAVRERDAAEKLFGLLPDGQGAAFRGLWEEFDAEQTPDARFAAAMDRLQPFLHNCVTQGHTWTEGRVTERQVYARMDAVRRATPALWPFVEQKIAEGVAAGWIRK